MDQDISSQLQHQSYHCSCQRICVHAETVFLESKVTLNSAFNLLLERLSIILGCPLLSQSFNSGTLPAPALGPHPLQPLSSLRLFLFFFCKCGRFLPLPLFLPSLPSSPSPVYHFDHLQDGSSNLINQESISILSAFS